MQRTPLVCFCTTTNVQDKKFVSLEDYVDPRKITGKKVLEASINKNYTGNNIPVFNDKTASINTCLQDRVRVVKVHLTPKYFFA